MQKRRENYINCRTQELYDPWTILPMCHSAVFCRSSDKPNKKIK